MGIRGIGRACNGGVDPSRGESAAGIHRGRAVRAEMAARTSRRGAGRTARSRGARSTPPRRRGRKRERSRGRDRRYNTTNLALIQNTHDSTRELQSSRPRRGRGIQVTFFEVVLVLDSSPTEAAVPSDAGDHDGAVFEKVTTVNAFGYKAELRGVIKLVCDRSIEAEAVFMQTCNLKRVQFWRWVIVESRSWRGTDCVS